MLFFYRKGVSSTSHTSYAPLGMTGDCARERENVGGFAANIFSILSSNDNVIPNEVRDLFADVRYHYRYGLVRAGLSLCSR
jgi:hypothetical protein